MNKIFLYTQELIKTKCLDFLIDNLFYNIQILIEKNIKKFILRVVLQLYKRVEKST